MNLEPNQILLTLEAMLVRRFHTCSTVEPQTVGLHSAGVAHIAIYLAGGPKQVSRELLLACLTHDQQELITGDIPFTSKRQFQDVKDAVREAEKSVDGCFLTNVSALEDELTEKEVALLKIADMLEGLLWTKYFERGQMIHERWCESFQAVILSAYNRRLLAGESLDRAQQLFYAFTYGTEIVKTHIYANRAV